MKILLTGAAGFIGMHTALMLTGRGDEVVGVDNLNNYYSVALKQARLRELEGRPSFRFVHADIADRPAMSELFGREKPQRVVHLAAQAGVRYGAENPAAYIDSNLVGFGNILEGCRRGGVEHLVFASSSSVYGSNAAMPFSEAHGADHPLSLYAATKRANELMAHSYAHLYHLPVTGLRFFTVYGPWGRPDMSLFMFTTKILAGEPIEIYNMGHHSRDFTYIDDIVDGVVGTLDHVAAASREFDTHQPRPHISNAPFQIYNIGNNQPVELLYFIGCLEKALGRQAVRTLLPLQPGDVEATYANIDSLAGAVGFRPKTSIEEGIKRFVAWYRNFYLS
jgi:UDP-glucuronate 4-epimerase